MSYTNEGNIPPAYAPTQPQPGQAYPQSPMVSAASVIPQAGANTNGSDADTPDQNARQSTITPHDDVSQTQAPAQKAPRSTGEKVLLGMGVVFGAMLFLATLPYSAGILVAGAAVYGAYKVGKWAFGGSGKSGSSTFPQATKEEKELYRIRQEVEKEERKTHTLDAISAARNERFYARTESVRAVQNHADIKAATRRGGPGVTPGQGKKNQHPGESIA